MTPCRILNVGPDADVRRSLRELVQTEGVLLQHIETGLLAFDELTKLQETELPDIVIIPFRLPILTAFDFISAMHSHQRLGSIPILVWWPEMEEQEINQLYRAGAACVLLGQLDTTHLEAVRRFCRSWNGIEPVAMNPSPEEISSTLRQADEQGDRNVQLGTLFVWTGCVSAVLWGWASLQPANSHQAVDLAPLPVYGSLACAGLSLMWGRSSGRARVPQ